MLKVEIQDEHIETRRQGDYTFYEQTAWVVLKDSQGRDNPHPERFIIQHNKPKDSDPVPHKIGHYILSPQSIYKNRYSQLDLGRLVLIPASQSNLKAA
jgi:hypothetical protein